MAARTDLLALSGEIPDPRVQRTRRHRLTDVLLLVLVGTVVGCRGWDAIEGFAYEREAELRDLLELPGGIPSADTFRRVMAAVEPTALARALTSWTDALCETYVGKQIAIDGKSVRGTLERAAGEGALTIGIVSETEANEVLALLDRLAGMLTRLGGLSA